MTICIHNTNYSDTWNLILIPTIQISNITYSDDYKYSIALMWLNFDIELRI